MEEHTGRYQGLATFLNEHHFSVFALDYFGQGENVLSKEQTLGNVPEHAGFNLYTDGLAHLVREIKARFLYLRFRSLNGFLLITRVCPKISGVS